MKAVLLAGGKGARLRPLTYSIPKPLLPIGEKPILEEIIDRLKAFDIEEFIIASYFATINPAPIAEDSMRWSNAKRDLAEHLDKTVFKEGQ